MLTIYKFFGYKKKRIKKKTKLKGNNPFFIYYNKNFMKTIKNYIF